MWASFPTAGEKSYKEKGKAKRNCDVGLGGVSVNSWF